MSSQSIIWGCAVTGYDNILVKKILGKIFTDLKLIKLYEIRIEIRHAYKYALSFCMYTEARSDISLTCIAYMLGRAFVLKIEIKKKEDLCSPYKIKSPPYTQREHTPCEAYYLYIDVYAV